MDFAKYVYLIINNKIIYDIGTHFAWKYGRLAPQRTLNVAYLYNTATNPPRRPTDI